MQIIEPYDEEKSFHHYVYENQLFYDATLKFNLSNVDFFNENISIIIYDKDLFEDTIDVHKSLLLYKHRFNDDKEYHDFSSMITFATHIYFCKKIGRKIKHTPTYTKIPILSPLDSSKKDLTKYHKSCLEIRLFFSNQFCDVINMQKYLCKNVVLQVKKLTKHPFMFMFYHDIFKNFINFSIKYIFLSFHCLNYYGGNDNIYAINTVVDECFRTHVLNYEHYFYDLMNRYPSMTLKLRIEPFDIIAVYEVHDNALVDHQFYKDLREFAFNILSPKYNQDSRIYVVF